MKTLFSLLLFFQVYNPSNPGNGGYFSGKVNLASGVYTYTFPYTYRNAPVCVASDNSGMNLVQVNVTTTSLTIYGVLTDTVSLICTGQ